MINIVCHYLKNKKFNPILCMQWIALENSRPITASMAIKQKKYLCPECHLPVRLRGGPHRQVHFYHLREAKSCSQHKKTEEHLGLQLALASSIPIGEAKIERAFPEIKRIADVAWETQKIVFEIQCSVISLEEVEKRCSDYRLTGWELLWILSDRRFNRKHLSAAEYYLRQQTCYFSHWRRHALHTQANPIFAFTYIYDQYEIINRFQRIYKGPKIKIDPILIKTHYAENAPAFSLPPSLQNRWDSWKLRVEGDILSKVSTEKPFWIETLKAIENHIRRRESPLQRLPWVVLIKKCYLHMINKILYHLQKIKS